MGLIKSIIRHTVGITCEMLTLKDPYDKRVEVKEISRRQEPRVSMSGRMLPGCREVITVQANNYRDVSRFTEGTTPQGNVSEVHTHVGHNRWEISTESWHTPENDYQEWLDEQRW